MRRVKYYIPFLFVTLLFIRCEEESFVEIDSVSALGDEFFYGQKVKVWTVVRTNDLPSARYTWSCEGGRMTQPQSLDENTWEAPRESGTYTVTCTVDVNGERQTRSRKMFVSTYFFDKFDRSTVATSSSFNTFTLNSSSSSLKDGHMEVRVSSTTATRGFMQRAFGDSELRVPLSTQMEVGWISNFPDKAIKIGNATAENTLYYEWLLNRDPDKEDGLFIDNIRFEWYPRGRSNGLPKDPNGNVWNGNFKIQQRNAATNAATAIDVYVNHPALNFAQQAYKKISMTVDANYIAHVYVGDVEVLSTDLIQAWRIANNARDEIYINQWRFNYVSNSGQTPLIYVNDAIAVNDGTILK